jgi:hypothetical protein
MIVAAKKSLPAAMRSITNLPMTSPDHFPSARGFCCRHQPKPGPPAVVAELGCVPFRGLRQ